MRDKADDGIKPKEMMMMILINTITMCNGNCILDSRYCNNSKIKINDLGLGKGYT